MPNDSMPTVPPQSGDGRTYWFQAHGYPIQYTTADGGTLCGKCVTEEAARGLDPACPDDDQFRPVAWELADGETPARCEHCGRDLSGAPEEEGD